MDERETKAFDSIKCKDQGRHYRCKMLRQGKVVDSTFVEEINTKDWGGNNTIKRVDSKAYSDRFSMSFDKPITGIVEPEGSGLEITIQ